MFQIDAVFLGGAYAQLSSVRGDAFLGRAVMAKCQLWAAIRFVQTELISLLSADQTQSLQLIQNLVVESIFKVFAPR